MSASIYINDPRPWREGAEEMRAIAAHLDDERSKQEMLRIADDCSAPRAGSKLTTPLHPDDYLRLLNPLWSSRELRGRVEKVVPETEDAATLVIRPGWGWRYDHRPGQYVGIGVQVDGKFQWRSYSVSSPPQARAAAPSRSPCGRCPRGCCPRTWSTGSSPARSCGWRCPRATSCCRTRRRSRCCSWSAAAGSPR